MSNNSWLNNGQWSSGQGLNQPQPQQQGQGNWQGNWMQAPPTGGGEWQAMQQATPPVINQGQAFIQQVPTPHQVQGHFPPGQFLGGGTPQGFVGGVGPYRGYSGVQGSGGIQRQSLPPQGYPQRLMSQQQIQQRHQQELERKAKEEQKQRELEIQRRKMMNINISNPTSGGVEGLIALPVPPKTGSPSRSRGHQQSESLTVSRSSAGVGSEVGSVVSEGRKSPSQATRMAGKRTTESNAKPADPDKERGSFEKLMESSLSNLSSHPPPSTTHQRTAFKFQHTAVPTSHGSAGTRTYSPSTKARAWTADTVSLKGVFAQHAQQEEEFGEFHAGPMSSHDQASGQRIAGHGGAQFTGQAAPTAGRAAPPAKLDTSKFPAVYLEVYKRCVESGEAYLSTELLFPILLSSQLPSRVLKDLWTQANRAVPGKLNQTELFLLLGLIALVQSGNASPTLADLKQAPQLPIPLLSAVQVSQGLPLSNDSSTQADEFGDFQQGHAPISQHPPQIPALVKPAGPSALVKPNLASASQQHPPQIPALVKPAEPSANVEPNLASAFPVAEYMPPSDDKYSIFSNLSKLPPPDASLLPPISSTQKPWTSSTQEPSTSSIQEPSTSSTQEPSTSSTQEPWTSSIQEPTQEPLTSLTLPRSAGWANFTGPPPPVPPSSSETTPPTGAAATVNATSAAAAFADILPMDFAAPKSTDEHLASETGKHSAPPETQRDEVTSFEMLEEEMTSRLAAPVTLPVQPQSVDAVSSITSLDDFAEFSASSVKGSVEVETNSGSSTSLTGRTEMTAPDACEVWCCCLEKCLEVLSSCAAVFTSVEEKAVLAEIVQSEEGTNKLKCIAEIYRLARRIYCSLKERNHDADCTVAVEAIKREWTTMVKTLPGDVLEQLYKETHPWKTEEGVEEGDILSDTISRCSLCLVGKVVSIPSAFSLTGGSPENYPLPLLFHEGQMYHSTCANFWCNVVQEKLPALRE